VGGQVGGLPTGTLGPDDTLGELINAEFNQLIIRKIIQTLKNLENCHLR
jgi:hypothetical protein